MKIWVDIANAPHATLFTPIVRELRSRGHDIVVTVFDRGQTTDLAQRAWPEASVVGSGFRRSVAGKGSAIARRALALATLMRDRRPNVALGHNSYSQVIAARLVGVPSVTMMDYEHQPANHVAFRLAHRVILPRAIPPGAVRRFGASDRKLLRYAGFKEEIALAGFVPEPDFRHMIGIPDDRTLVTMRPPPAGALYHRGENALFDELMALITRSTDAIVLVVPRTRSQASRYKEESGIRLLHETVSGPDLLFTSDVVVGAGGTMTREAAILGTPTFSVFRGRPAAVDRTLERQGRLRSVADTGAFPLHLIKRHVNRGWRVDPSILVEVIDLLEKACLEIQGSRRRSGPQGV